MKFAPNTIEHYKRRNRWHLAKWLVIIFLAACFLSGVVLGFLQ